MALVWVGGMCFSARAYSLALASVVAPFEYMTLPIKHDVGLSALAAVPHLVDPGWRCF